MWTLLRITAFFLALLSCSFHVIAGRGLTLPIGDDRAPNPQLGRICAYGDINKDRYTDLVVQQGLKLFILLQSENGQFKENHRYGPIELPRAGDVFCAVGDFNGDAMADILVVSPQISSGVKNYIATVYYSHDNNYQPTALAPVYSEHPIVVDINGDGISDILGFTRNDLNTNDAKYTLSCIAGVRPNGFEDCSERFGHYNGSTAPYPSFPHIFADLDGDLSAELVFGTKSYKIGLQLNVWKLSTSGFEWHQTNTMIPPLPDDPDFTHFGAPLVGDFNADRATDILIPICRQKECTQVDKFLVWSLPSNRWESFQLDMKEAELILEPNSLVMFRAGEFSLDGFPDLLATVRMNGITGPMILQNTPSDNGNFSRKFEINLQKDFRIIMPPEMAKAQISMSSFFDLKEDGNLDILVEYRTTVATYIDFIKCDDKGDTTFLKAQIFSNVCTNECPATPSSDSGSGISWVGACASFSMSTSYGQPKVSVQCQLPQTSYRTFHSPFLLFGLGRSPNFVDEVVFGSPRWPAHNYNQLYKREQIVPNSRIIVIPPEKDGTHWQSRLYLTPSRLIIQSLIVQVTVCVILFCLVVALHIRERKHDRRERQSQSHRFHFDAM